MRIENPIDSGQAPIRVRTLRGEDEAAFLAAVAGSADLHGDWYSTASTPAEFRERLEQSDGIGQIDYVFVHLESGDLAGTATIGNIVRKRFQSGYLGFAAFEPFAGRGLMTAGLRQVIADAFSTRGLHRLEANVQPGNAASKALVERLGFRLEGHSPRYLHLAGAWRDHDRYAITAEEVVLAGPGMGSNRA